MAYVAISKDLIERVKENIHRMRKSEVAGSCPGVASGREVTKDVSALFTKGCWGEYAYLLEKMPKEDWLRRCEVADIHVIGEATLNDRPFTVKTSVRFRGLTNAWAKPSTGYYGDSHSKFSIEEVNALPDGVLGKSDLLERYEEALVEAEINLRWAKIMNDIVEFLGKCKSLNEAVKLLPAVKMYVDKGDIQRMERKVERAPRQELVSGVDTGAITASAVAARLMASMA